MSTSHIGPHSGPLQPHGDELLAQRLRAGLYITLAVIVVFAVRDLGLRGLEPVSLYWMKALQFLAVVAAVGVLPLAQSRVHSTRIALFTLLIVSFTAAAQGNITGDAQTIPLLLGVTMMGMAALIPWGAGPQATAVVVAAVAAFWNLAHVQGGVRVALDYPALTMAMAGVVSVLIAHELARSRNVLTRAQDELRASEQNLRRIFDQLEDVYYRIDARGLLQMVSPSVERFGYRASDLIGREAEVFYKDPADRQRMTEVLLEHRSVTDVELMLKHRDGTPIPASVSAHLLFDEQGQVVGVEGILRDITLRKRHEDHLSTLLQIGRDVSGSLDLDDILETVQRRVVESLPCEGVVIFRFDPDQKLYRLMSHHGDLPDGVSLLRTVTFPAGSDVDAHLRAGETVVAGGIEKAPPVLAEAMSRIGATAVVVLPLLVHRNLFGAIIAFTRGDRCFDPEQVQLLENIARQVAVAAENVTLYRSQQQDAAVAGALAEIGRALIASHSTTSLHETLCKVVARELACDFSYTFVRPADEDGFRTVGVHEEKRERAEALRLLEVPLAMVTGLVAGLDEHSVVQVRTAEPQNLIPAALLERFDVTSVVCIALRRRGDLIGVLAAGYHGRDAPFSPQQLRVARGITEIASLALENARLLEELEAADRFRANFVATMSHEMRTPLGVTLGYIELLLDGQFGPLTAEQKDTLERAGRSSRELLDLVTATLDLSRMESERIQLHRSDVDVAEMLDELARETKIVAHKPELRLEWEFAPHLPTLHTDRVKLRMVLKNLIGNALKFTSVGQVIVRAIRCHGGVEFSVSDTGIGIAPEQHEAIFEPFRQGDHQAGGAGLGLHIVRRLLAAMGGAVTVESEVGRGSTFRVWIPDAETTRAATAAAAH